MLIPQIPCGVSTSALVPNNGSGLSGLGRRRGMGGLGWPGPDPAYPCQFMICEGYQPAYQDSNGNCMCPSYRSLPVRTVGGRPSLQGLGCMCGKGLGNYIAQTGAVPSSDIFGLTPKGRPCACSNGLRGLTFDGTGLFGSGLFTSGMDYSQWGMGEYAALAVGGYILMSVFSTTKRTARVVRRKARAVAKA